MKRYFFDLHTLQSDHLDEFGEIFADDGAAHDCAWDVVAEHFRSARKRHGQEIAVTVRDESGLRFRTILAMSVEGTLMLPGELLRGGEPERGRAGDHQNKNED
ncbi:MAG: DUF6894 family protein [Pseudolabrys sp.]